MENEGIKVNENPVEIQYKDSEDRWHTAVKQCTQGYMAAPEAGTDIWYENGLAVVRRLDFKDNTVTLTYTGVCDRRGRYTFGDSFSVCLDQRKEGAASHVMQLAADLFEWIGQEQTVTGEMRSVKNSPLDFREDKFIGEALESHHPQIRAKEGIDHAFVLNEEKEALWLYSPRTRESLVVDTTWPEVQVTCGGQDKEISLRFGFLRPVKMEAGQSFGQTLTFVLTQEMNID